MKSKKMLLGAAAVGAVYLFLRKPKAPELPGSAPSGLGFIWIWAKDYYTVWNGTKYLPARYTTSGAAMDWLLDEKERNWGKTVNQFKKVGSNWQKVA